MPCRSTGISRRRRRATSCDCGAKVLVVHADLLAQIASGIPAGVKVLAVPTPEEIGAAYNVAAGEAPAAGAETWDAFVAASAPNTEPPKARAAA